MKFLYCTLYQVQWRAFEAHTTDFPCLFSVYMDGSFGGYYLMNLVWNENLVWESAVLRIALVRMLGGLDLSDRSLDKKTFKKGHKNSERKIHINISKILSICQFA